MYALILKANPYHDQATGRFTSRGNAGWTASHEARMKALKVPPGVSNVRLNDNPKAPLQARWTDSKGREVRLYSAEHSEKAAAEKWQRVKDFHKSGAAAKVMSAAKRDMANGNLTDRERDTAAVMYLVAKTGFRIGSDRATGAEVQAFGASTLQKQHIKLKGSTIQFSFTGKKGVSISKTLESKELASYLGQRLKSLKPSQNVFEATDNDARDYVKANGGGKFKVKDFRTWQATAVALKEIKKLPAPTTQTQANKQRKQVATVVSDHLGNTPTVALNSYIPPFVFDSWGTFSRPPVKAKKAEESLETLMDEAVATVFYDVVGDWESMPELGEDE